MLKSLADRDAANATNAALLAEMLAPVFRKGTSSGGMDSMTFDATRRMTDAATLNSLHRRLDGSVG
jgi:hypothetical protein